jgi:TM2 domain-containing membrane protein YozV
MSNDDEQAAPGEPDWHVRVQDCTYGPVDAETVRAWIHQGRITPDTHVWSEGLPNWTRAGTVEAFRGAFPPVVPPRAGGPPPRGTAAARFGPEGEDVLNKKVVAGIMGILFGAYGVHKFILGYTSAGVTMLLLTLLTCGIGGVVMAIIGLIEGITYLTAKDEQFVADHIHQGKPWF